MQTYIKSYLILLFLLFSPLCLISQITIKIVNIETNFPIENASVYNEANHLIGFSNEEGIIKLDNNINKITIRANDYLPKIEMIGKLDKTIYLLKKIDKKSDPKAVSILKKLWENSKKNNADYLNTYKFDSYVKFTLDMPSDSVSYIYTPKRKLDTLNNKLKSFLEKSMVFIGERTMLYEYDKKYGKKGIVTAYKAGGFHNAQFFNFSIAKSFVNDYPEILKPREMQGNVSKLVDSIYINNRKTYVIYTYSHGKGETQFYKNLTVFVDSENYALVKLIGNNSKISNIYYEITYTPYEGIWYTEDEFMKTEILSSNFIKKINKLLPKGLHSITRLNTTATIDSHITNFTNDISYSPKDFKGYEYAISKDVSNQVDEKISLLRKDSLTKREATTYSELNRIFDKYKLESRLKFFRKLSEGELELGFFNFDVYSMFSHNLYESFRYQLGGHTNYKFSKKTRLGGYIAKASRDEEAKGGADVTFFINKQHGGELSFKAETDVLPVGRTKIKYLTAKDELTAKTNNIYNGDYFSYRKVELSYQQDFFKNLDITFVVDYQRQRVNFHYKFKDYDESTWFNYVNTAIRLRYAPNVKYIESSNGKYTLQDKPPYYYFTYSKSWKLFENSTGIHRLYLSALYTFLSKMGKTEIIGNVGATFGETPLMDSFEGNGVAKHGKSIWGRFSFKGFQSFETMKPSSFFSDRFVSFQFSHHFRPLRVNEFKSLHFTVLYNGLIGWMPDKDLHSLFEFDVPKDYYQEVGFEVNKLLLGLVGVGVYVRLGAYKVGNLDQNLSVKLNMDI